MKSQPLRRHFVAAIVPLVAFAACSGAEGSAVWAGTVDTLANGVVQVTNPASGVWTEATAWRVEEDLRIGRLEGEGPDLFGAVGGLVVDDAGRIWVLENQAQEVRVFDADGSHVRTVGRKGGGPGEFASVSGMLRDPVGRMWVYDSPNNRISVIDTAGRFVTSHRIIGNITISPFPGIFDNEGRFYTYTLDQSSDDFAVIYVRTDTALTVLDTVVPPRRPESTQYFEIRSENNVSRTTVPFTPTEQWTFTPEGDFWIVRTGAYELFHRTAEGDTLRRVTRAFDPLPVTAEDRDSLRVRFADWIERGATIDFSRIPDHKPAVSDLVVDPDGYLWVERVTASRADRGRQYDIFDPEGRFLGEIRLPFAIAGSPVFRDGYLYAVTRDDLEVPYVVRARIVRPEAE